MTSVVHVVFALGALSLLGLQAVSGNHGVLRSPLSWLNDQKIIGGFETTISKYPFMGSITIVEKKSSSLECGCTLLGNRQKGIATHILSAAHCFYDRLKEKSIYRVRVGSDYWAKGGQVRGLSEIELHNKYKPATYDYDVAVAKLDRPVKLGPNVALVNLVKTNVPVQTGKSITMLGWGYTDALRSFGMSPKLRSVESETIDHSECEEDYAESEKPVTKRMICGMVANKDTCQGDSGGPILYTSSKKQVGIVSWGLGCAQMGFPGVFTDLTNVEVKQFIYRVLNKKSSSKPKRG